MVFSSSSNQVQTSVYQSLGKYAGIFDDLPAIGGKRWLSGFMKGCGNCRGLMIVRTSLKTRENCLVDFIPKFWIFFQAFMSNHDERSSRSAQRLVRRRGDDMGVLCRRGMYACCDKSCNMGNICGEITTNFIGNFGKSVVVENERIGSSADPN